MRCLKQSTPFPPDAQMHPANHLRFQDGDPNERVRQALNSQSECISASSGVWKSSNHYGDAFTLLLSDSVEAAARMVAANAALESGTQVDGR